ncbi:hypothetical protein [Pasteurella sp. PK-2025]|uniref:hypothetical protein n=1 Tax=Pasteurella sp. PK-2025 TaxID=3413133 RepID=UPI003C78A097
MKNGINLLPWRQQQHQQRCKKWLAFLLAMLCALLLSKYVLAGWQQQLTERLQQAQTAVQHKLRELTEIKQHIDSLQKQQIKTDKLIPIASQHALHLSALLLALPLGRGELVSFGVQQNEISLKGYVENHEDFSALQHHLEIQPLFKQVELVHFQPEQTQLWFEFKLLFTPDLATLPLAWRDRQIQVR